MIYAAGAGRSSVVALLLDRGVDPNRVYDHDLTALMWAAGYGRTDTVSLLVSRGADVSWRDDRGLDAAAIAGRGRHEETRRVLEAAAR